MYDRPLPLTQEDTPKLHPKRDPDLELIRARLTGTSTQVGEHHRHHLRVVRVAGAQHLDQRHQRTCIHDGRLPGLRSAGERLQSTGSKPACLWAAKQLDQKAHRPGCCNLAIYHLVAGARELPR